jgi:hypothetical protein
MASKQAAAKRAPAKSRNTGKRKAAKPPAVVTSTPKTRPRPRPISKATKAVAEAAEAAEPADDYDDTLTDIFEEGHVSLFDVANQVDAADLIADREVFDQTDSIFRDDVEGGAETNDDVDARWFFCLSSVIISFNLFFHRPCNRHCL